MLTVFWAGQAGAEVRARYAIDNGQQIVRVLPGTIAGPGDRKPTPNGQMLLRYLKMSPSWRFPTMTGGLNIVDVEDVAVGHILAMEKGTPGVRAFQEAFRAWGQ